MRADRIARRRRAAAAVLALAAAGACNGDRIDRSIGSGGFQLRTTTLHVNDTMTVRAGAIYNNGRFIADPSATFHSLNEAVVKVDAASGLILGNSAGTAQITANLRQGVVVDTTITVVP